MTTATNIDPVEAFLNDLVANPDLTDDVIVTALSDISDRIAVTVRSLTAPMTHDQRKAMFAAFANIFGSTPKEARKVFTRLVLGKAADAPVSWAEYGDRNGQGALTVREASRVLDALAALEAAL